MFLFFQASFILISCNPTKRLKEGEYLLDQMDIRVVDKTRDYTLPVWDMEDVIKQKTNRRIFKTKFHLWVHNLPNPEKVARKAEKRRKKLEARNQKNAVKDSLKNEKRIAKGKEPRTPSSPKEYTPVFGEWLMNTVGEPPVILDSADTKRSVEQLNLFLIRKGFFNNEVTDSIAYHRKKPKASVFYLVRSKTPYRIRDIYFNIPDSRLHRFVEYAWKEDSLIHINDIFDIDKLDDERNRLTEYLQNRGYYGFTKDFIYFQVDSALQSNQVSITMGISNIRKKIRINNRDSIIEESHNKYFINKVYVITNFDSRNRGDDPMNYDTVTYAGKIFANIHQSPVKEDVLAGAIFINQGLTYRKKEVDATYKQLNSLGVFRSINIRFSPPPDDESGMVLDAYIIIVPTKRQFVQLEADGTHTGGNYGLQGSFDYTNKNLLRGAEKLKFTTAGALEIQQLLTNQGESLTPEGGIFGRYNPFNTFEIGPELAIEFPKILLARRRWLKKWLSQHTTVKARINYQERPDFTRGLQDISIIFDGQPHIRAIHQLRLLEISALEINPSPEFSNRLDLLNDAVLKAAYQDHIIAGTQYSFTYTDQNAKKQKNNLYYRGTVKGAGNALRGLYALTNQPLDSLGSYRLFGIRFAQFVKTTHELRWYQNYNEKSKMVYRFYGGVGIPLRNLREAMPFEESFFAGGSVGIRGWRARALGPGGYLDTTFAGVYDRIGDMQLEANMEYRFDLLDIIEGALFVDAGNIWMLRPGARQNAEIGSDFFKQIALSTGLGFRIDLSFFIIRLDLGLQLHDPSLGNGERWIFQPKDQHNAIRARARELYPDLNIKDYPSAVVNLNFGLGYPF